MKKSEEQNVKIPISRDNSGRKAVNSSNNGTFSDIKKPTDLRGVKFGSKIDFNFKKFLLIFILFLGIVFILFNLDNWYRDFKGNTPIEIETQTEEPSQPIEPEIIEATSTPEEVIEITEVINKVTILDTETGWLNVRESAGTSYKVMTKVYPDESYVLLDETEEWYKIELPNEQEGWIFKEYAIKE